MKKEIYIGIICALVILSMVIAPLGYFVGKGEREIVASNCGDVVCPECPSCPDVNITVPPTNQTTIHNNITNIHYTNITNISGDYRRDIDVTASLDHNYRHDFSDWTTDDDCAVSPQITIDNELKQIDLWIQHSPWMVPDSLCVKFTMKNSAIIGNNTSVVSVELIGNLKMWTVLNITTLKEVYVVERSDLQLSAIAWKTSYGTWIGSQEPGAVARLKPGEWDNLGLTIYFNEDELPFLDWGGSGYFESNQLPIVFRSNGEIAEVYNLRIYIVWLP